AAFARPGEDGKLLDPRDGHLDQVGVDLQEECGGGPCQEPSRPEPVLAAPRAESQEEVGPAEDGEAQPSPPGSAAPQDGADGRPADGPEGQEDDEAGPEGGGGTQCSHTDGNERNRSHQGGECEPISSHGDPPRVSRLDSGPTDQRRREWPSRCGRG